MVDRRNHGNRLAGRLGDPMTRVHWRWLTKDLKTLNEAEVKRLLFMEVDNEKRRDIVIRLHQRYCTLRAKRERQELLQQITEY